MKFRLRRGQPVRKVVRKLFAFHLERCRAVLSAPPPLPPGQVHEVRKSTKRLRALIALVGSHFGRRQRWFDRQLRELNRHLASVRDAEALQEAFERLIVGDDPFPDDFAAVRVSLLNWAAQHERLSARNLHRALRCLETLVGKWSAARLPKRGWALLKDDLFRTYRRARRTVRRLPARPSAEELHELRKRVKQVQYHWEFLQPLWPPRMTAELEQLELLSDALGQHHDAEMLRLWVTDGRRGDTVARHTVQRLLRLVDRQQQQLAAEARRLAALCFAEPPRSVCQRLRRYWRVWRTQKAEVPAVPPVSTPARPPRVGVEHEDAVAPAAR
uniref:CHAD domain-containing protein n=1 Tax=Schlesneria paludicola TaxID=360056 RepID=A0A7C4LRU0_9PLAN